MPSTLGSGDAVRISTGAPVPETRTAVVRVEDTVSAGDAEASTSDGRVAVVDDRDVRGATAVQRHVRPRGEDVPAGTTVLEAGTTITAADAGVLASVGAAQVHVVRRPRLALVSSGDELVDVDAFDEVLGGRRIVSSNGYTLAAQATLAGAEVRDLGATPDDRDVLRDRLAAALNDARGCDVLVTSGGVSVGAHDHTRDALTDLGLTLAFWRVRIRPGGPFGFGTLRDASGRIVRWLGIPGNPVSAMVTMELFGRPLLRRLGGHARVHRRRVSVRVLDPIRTPAPLTHFLRASLDVDASGQLVARLTGAQGSNLLTSMARADALLVIPEDVAELPAQSTVSAILLGEGALDAASP